MKWYKANAGYFVDIKEVEVERETASIVWVKGRRQQKKSTYDNYFPTYEEAYGFIHGKISKDIEQIKNQLKQAEDKLQEVELLKFPKSNSSIN